MEDVGYTQPTYIINENISIMHINGKIQTSNANKKQYPTQMLFACTRWHASKENKNLLLRWKRMAQITINKKKLKIMNYNKMALMQWQYASNNGYFSCWHNWFLTCLEPHMNTGVPRCYFGKAITCKWNTQTCKWYDWHGVETNKRM